MPCREVGQTMVEFAVLGVVLFMLTVGLIDVGRAFYAYNMAANAAREAARFAAVNGGSWGTFKYAPGYNGNWPNTYAQSTGYPVSYFAATQAITPTVVGTAAKYAPGLDPNDLSVTITALGGPRVGNPIGVRLDYTFRPATSLFVGGQPITITASSAMVIE